jgi:hypothetical protein
MTASPPHPIPLPLLTERDVARVVNMSLASVRKWRLYGRGPRYIKINTAVRYRPEDVNIWLATCPVHSGGGEPRRNANGSTPSEFRRASCGGCSGR